MKDHDLRHAAAVNLSRNDKCQKDIDRFITGSRKMMKDIVSGLHQLHIDVSHSTKAIQENNVQLNGEHGWEHSQAEKMEKRLGKYFKTMSKHFFYNEKGWIHFNGRVSVTVKRHKGLGNSPGCFVWHIHFNVSHLPLDSAYIHESTMCITMWPANIGNYMTIMRQIIGWVTEGYVNRDNRIGRKVFREANRLLPRSRTLYP